MNLLPSDPFFPDFWTSLRHNPASAEEHSQVPQRHRQHEAVQ